MATLSKGQVIVKVRGRLSVQVTGKVCEKNPKEMGVGGQKN